MRGTRVRRLGGQLLRQRRVIGYRLRGRLPWSEGYADVKLSFLAAALADGELLKRFNAAAPLPTGYGVRLDERVIEYPWVFTRLSDGPGRFLDAGSTLNHELLLGQPRVAGKRITIVTLAPEPLCYWSRGISYDFEDLRALPYRDATFDEIVCISTLEHVGMDNSMYGASAAGGADFVAAARELTRVLRPGGRLLATVPYGRGEDHGFQRVFDAESLGRLVASLAPLQVVASFYRYTAAGWIVADQESCRECVYFNIHERGYGGPGPVRYDPDFAAAARAVACLEAMKPS